MEAFNCAQQVLSLADLNKRTRLPKSTLHRLVDQLCQIGWLERDHGGYRWCASRRRSAAPVTRSGRSLLPGRLAGCDGGS
jgi:DNA-binding IclR family transcriptional regulator